jgi:hypothetical protein
MGNNLLISLLYIFLHNYDFIDVLNEIIKLIFKKKYF